MVELLAILAFIGAGIPFALVFFTRVQAVFASVIFVGLIATAAGVVHVATNIPIALVWLALVLAGYGFLVGWPRLRRRLVANARSAASAIEYIQLGVAVTVAILLTALPGAPAWDGRSIWLFHASWLNSDSFAFINGQTAPALLFSHPNYPILGPASIAVTWGIAGGTENLFLGEQVIAIATILLGALAASITIRRFAGGGHPTLSTVSFVAMVTLPVMIAAPLINLGYMDPLQACFIAVLATLLLVRISRRMTMSDAVLASMVGIAASNVKQEGFWFTLATLVVFLVLTVREQYKRKYIPLAAVVVFYVLWKLFLSALHASDTTDASGIGGRILELVTPGSQAWSILVRIAKNELSPILHQSVIVAVVVIATVWLEHRHPRVTREILFLAITGLCLVGIVLLTFALGNTRAEIDFWLVTSFDRVIASGELMLWYTIFLCVIVVSPWRKRRDSINA